MSPRLWLLVIFAFAGALAPSRADARGAETCAQGFLATATTERPESEPQVAGTHQGFAAFGYESASGYSRAAESGAGQTLYRAVGPDELADIGAAGSRYRVPAGGTEGKYFFETPEQTSNFAQMMGDKVYTTTSVEVSPSQLARGQAVNPAGEGPGYFFSTPDVPSGPVTIFNQSKLP